LTHFIEIETSVHIAEQTGVFVSGYILSCTSGRTQPGAEQDTGRPDIIRRQTWNAENLMCGCRSISTHAKIQGWRKADAFQVLSCYAKEVGSLED